MTLGGLLLKRLRAHAPFLIVLVVAGIMRLYLWKRTGVDLWGDMLRYNAMAWNLLQHGYLGYASGPDAFVTPLYPMFIAFLYKLSMILHGGSVTSIRMVHQVYLAQQVLSLFMLVLIYMLGTLLRSKWVGFWAALLSVIYLPNGFIGLMLLTEALFMPLLIATFVAFIYAQKSQKAWAYAVSGILLGLTTLVRPTVLPLIALFVLLDLWQRFTDSGTRTPMHGTVRAFSLKDPAFWRSNTLMIAGLVITMLPWWIRNEIDFHHLILLSTESGNPLLAGADPYFQVSINQLIQASRALHESQETFAIHYMLQGFAHHFWLFAGWYIFGKLPYLFWTPWVYAYIKTFVLYHRVVVIVGAIAMIATLARPYARVISWSALFLLGVQMVFLPITRYGYPIIVLWSVLIPVVAECMWSRLKAKRGVRL